MRAFVDRVYADGRAYSLDWGAWSFGGGIPQRALVDVEWKALRSSGWAECWCRSLGAIEAPIR